jgi:hypothetical protein
LSTPVPTISTLATGLTLAGWFYLPSISGSAQCVISLGNSTTISRYCGVGIASVSSKYVIRGFIAPATGETDANGTVAVPTGAWCLNAVTFTLGTVNSYLNNTLAATNSFSGVPTLNVATLGVVNNGGSLLARPSSIMWIGECAIWLATLTQAEIADMYFNRRPLNAYRAGSLFAYWPLRALNAVTEPDLGPYGSDIGLVGSVPSAPHPPVYLLRKSPIGARLQTTKPNLINLTPTTSYPSVWDVYRANPFDLLP